MIRWGLMLLLGFAAIPAGQAAVQTGPVEYKSGTTVLNGYLAYDDAIKGKRPGVLVVHEWWGHNEYARKRARMLAELGYTALAVDMYGDGRQAAHPQDAGKFSAEVRKNLPEATARFNAARQLLAAHPTVDGSRIAAIGYCFGGAIVLEMARLGQDLKAVASFHGNLTTQQPARAGKNRTRVLVLTGADDPFIPNDQVEAFRKEMDAAGMNYRIVAYPGARHSFTSPEADQLGKQFDLPALAYHAESDRKSWAEMQVFLKEAFAGK